MMSAQRKALTCRSRAINLEVNTCKRVAVDALCTETLPKCAAGSGPGWGSDSGVLIVRPLSFDVVENQLKLDLQIAETICHPALYLAISLRMYECRAIRRPS